MMNNLYSLILFILIPVIGQAQAVSEKVKNDTITISTTPNAEEQLSDSLSTPLVAPITPEGMYSPFNM